MCSCISQGTLSEKVRCLERGNIFFNCFPIFWITLKIHKICVASSLIPYVIKDEHSKGINIDTKIIYFSPAPFGSIWQHSRSVCNCTRDY
jgi:hypothetical protein